jgi:hypothetical protein
MDSFDNTHLLPLWMMDFFLHTKLPSENYFLSFFLSVWYQDALELLPDYVHEIIITWIFVKWNRL